MRRRSLALYVLYNDHVAFFERGDDGIHLLFVRQRGSVHCFNDRFAPSMPKLAVNSPFVARLKASSVHTDRTKALISRSCSTMRRSERTVCTWPATLRRTLSHSKGEI